MAKFYQQVKSLITDIEKFLTESVKDSKINKKALEQKTSILTQITDLKNDYPQLSMGDEGGSNQQAAPDPAQEEDECLYEDTDNFAQALQAAADDICKREVPATDISGVVHSGQLKFRKDKKGNILTKIAAKKFHCVLRGNLFYLYDKKNSKKQNECFSTDGYVVSSLEDESKKEFMFEMSKEDKKTFIFEAASQEELQTWLKHLGYEAPLTDLMEEGEIETYSGGDGEGEAIEEALYEDTDAVMARVVPSVSSAGDESPPPLPGPPPARGGPPTRGGPPPALPSRPGPPPTRELPQPVPADNNDDIYDATEPAPADNPDDIYDETGPEVVESPKANSSSLFSNSLQEQSRRLESPQSSFRSPYGPPPPPKKSLPPTPAQKQTNGLEDDYANMYYGVWDSVAGQEKELSFQRGDIITVISRKYDSRGWWVGRLHDQIGLVPRDFLSPAYEKAP